MAILCIDDDPRFCAAIAGALADAGYEAVAARTAGEGLQSAAAIDLAIVDLHLRGLSGDALVRAIREVREIPIILTSGVSPEDGRLVAQRCGAQHFLPKPFDVDELLRVVDTLLGEAKDAREDKRRRGGLPA